MQQYIHAIRNGFKKLEASAYHWTINSLWNRCPVFPLSGPIFNSLKWKKNVSRNNVCYSKCGCCPPNNHHKEPPVASFSSKKSPTPAQISPTKFSTNYSVVQGSANNKPLQSNMKTAVCNNYVSQLPASLDHHHTQPPVAWFSSS